MLVALLNPTGSAMIGQVREFSKLNRQKAKVSL
jgi:hypothetical protein